MSGGGHVPRGPRILGRLTVDLVMSSPQYMNTCREYEIDLRGNRVTVIENLGVTKNQFDSMDLSDNSVVKLEGFPLLPRLRCVYLNNNRLVRIAKDLHQSLPNLETLILTNNSLTRLQDVANLAPLAKLKHLSLLDNPVSRKPGYRLFAVACLPQLRWLDFKKVTQREREAAAKEFGAEGAKEAAVERDAAGGAAVAGGKTFTPGEGVPEEVAAANGAGEGGARRPPTAEELTAIKAAIAGAATLEEVERYEGALATGVLPSDLAEKLKGAGARMETD
ncbi:unnamed protein product [Pedinophyceae sp. YPF-701]|nr:unnamed protein product [Pedinophyceae sp. YPF-701]